MPELAVGVIPPHEQVPGGFDETQGVAQPAADGDVEHGQRAAGTTDAVDDRVDEQIVGVEAERLWHRTVGGQPLPFRVVVNSALSLEHGDQADHAEAGLGILECSWCVQKLEVVAFRRQPDLFGRVIEPLQIVLDRL